MIELKWSKHPVVPTSLIAVHDTLKRRYLVTCHQQVKGFEKAPVRAYVFDAKTIGIEIYAGSSHQDAMTACHDHALRLLNQAA